MLKVKMLTRHTAPSGRKLEKGLEYSFPPDYAAELMSHGLAVLVVMPPEPPAPGFVAVRRRPVKSPVPKIQASATEPEVSPDIPEKPVPPAEES